MGRRIMTMNAIDQYVPWTLMSANMMQEACAESAQGSFTGAKRYSP
jgi:hypothetical protein